MGIVYGVGEPVRGVRAGGRWCGERGCEGAGGLGGVQGDPRSLPPSASLSDYLIVPGFSFMVLGSFEVDIFILF